MVCYGGSSGGTKLILTAVYYPFGEVDIQDYILRVEGMKQSEPYRYHEEWDGSFLDTSKGDSRIKELYVQIEDAKRR